MPAWELDHKTKAAFFDADGTMLSFTTHEMPASTRRALHELRLSGVKCFLATGRPPYFVDDIPTDDLEAFILFNGQLVLNRHTTFFEQTLDREDVATVVGQVREGLYNCAFFERDRVYISGEDELVRALCEAIDVHFDVADIERALHNDVYQLNAFIRPGETGVLTDATRHLKVTRWSPSFVDVLPIGGGKARAVRRVLKAYDIAPEEAICFGDGGNDVEMFGVVGASIAMGNANPEVREVADFVTDSVDDDGIWNACKRLGLIRG